LRVSALGVGCNNFGTRIDADEARAVVDAALELGVTLFDTAPAYGNGASEELLGKALSGRRDEAVIATKCAYRAPADAKFAPGSRRAIRAEVELSLRRLQTDRIDLYQMHFADPTTPLEETLAAMQELVIEGKVLYIGSCNLAAWQVVAAEALARASGMPRFISAQNHYNLIERDAERELIPASAAYGIGLLPFYPLANGLLTGKYRRGEEPPQGSRLAADTRRHLITDESLRQVEAIGEFASRHGTSTLDVAIGGLAAQPVVGSVIAGARSPEQVRGNVRAVEWTPTDAQLAELYELLERLAPT
jgi:aryl-alcohol dehydrogenase-like predicted oxidoreductase